MFLQLLIFTVNFALDISALQFILQDRDLKIPDYDYVWHDDYRKAFMVQKTKNQDNETIESDQNHIVVDSIPHELINRNNSKWEKINTFENNFKKLIGMKGVKYIYKRDMIWRTWRRVNYPNAKKKIVCYRCENKIISNCSSCHSGGYWVIDENPPCPYEFFSINKEDQLCAANLSQYEDKNSSCASVMRIENIINICDNPIETAWRITKVYDTPIFVQPGTNICEGRENCKILTVYAIYKDYVIFRIINSNNAIIYSRVMKKGGNNYACIEDCGHRDPKTKTVMRAASLDLLSASNKRKRENKLIDKKEIQTKKYLSNFTEKNKMHSIEKLQTTTMSNCKKLSLRKTEFDDSERDYEY